MYRLGMARGRGCSVRWVSQSTIQKFERNNDRQQEYFCHSQITHTCCSSKGKGAQLTQSARKIPANRGRESVQTVDKYKWRNRRNRREAWRWASRKKKWRRFHAKHEIHTKNCSMFNSTHKSENEYDWQPLSQPFFSLQVLWLHNSMCFQISMK